MVSVFPKSISTRYLKSLSACMFGMSAVYASRVGLELVEISTFVATFYIGALILQYPLGWLSDRIDRRLLIMVVSAVGGVGATLGFFLGGNYYLLLAAAFLIGGMSNPLYSLLIAYTNDYLQHDDMAAASGGLVFINGLGAIAGPLITGWLMGDSVFGPPGFFLFIAMLLLVLVAYGAYRMTQRAATPVEETGTMTPIMATGTAVAVEFAQEYAIDADLEEQEAEKAA